eukprot:TRINITY_DN8957_c0_g1_i1.p1 TRINITY_DN8957_c0_g1~~TRINITY_DN8957_c0_g1_i1.p1  ORF type:complete len:722 (+),score=265.08 TRINITY_DN8957_c0_g1_i1:145-2310(+)
MKKSVSSISLEELHLLAQKSEQSENLSKLMDGVESDSESQKDEYIDENGNDEHYTMENLVEENQTLHNQNEQMKKQIEDLRHLLLQVFSDTRSMLLTEDTIQQYLPNSKSAKGSDHEDNDHEEDDHEEDHEEHDEHDDIEDFSTEGQTSNNRLSVDEENKYEKSEDIVQEGHQRKEPDIDLPEGELDPKKKLKKKKNKKQKPQKPKKPKSIINMKGRSKAKKKLKKLKKKTKKKKLLKQLFVGTKGVLFGSHKANKQPEAILLKQKIYQELSKHISIVKETETKQLEQLLMKEKEKKDFGGFYFCNLGVVIDKWLLWKKLMPRAKAFYAVKSNPDVNLVRTLAMLGAGFDCASKPELEEVLSLGVKTEDIIFANPCKGRDHIEYAKNNGVAMMTFDNSDELGKIFNMYKEAQLVLRILPDDSHSLMPFGTKFGASLAESTKLIKKCKEIGANLIGVSFHVGSGCFSNQAWPDAIKLARQIWDIAVEEGFQMKLLDIGGGFPGTDNTKLKFPDIAEAACNSLNEIFPEKNIKIIAEPGRYFCTEAYTLAVNIISKRTKITTGTQAQNHFRLVGNDDHNEDSQSEVTASQENTVTEKKMYYLSDGVYGSFNNIVFDHANPLPIPLKTFDENAELHKSCLFGPTCDSIDVICRDIDLPELELDDWIYFPHMGAYTISSASSFNGFTVPNSKYFIIMDDETPPQNKENKDSPKITKEQVKDLNKK